jgi:3-methylcrotonyl-CoA carboxylase alpha subunit
VDFLVDDRRIAVPVAPATGADAVRLAKGAIAVMKSGETFVVHPYDPFAAADASGSSADRIVTPMPGKIAQLMVRPGDKLAKGQPIAVLEAMKMEHTLVAPADVQIATVDVSQGDQVNEGTIVVRFLSEKKTAA